MTTPSPFPFSSYRARLLTFFLLIASFAGCAVARVEPTREASRYDFRSLEKIVQSEIESGAIPSAALAVAKDGVIVYENAFGWADKERRAPVNVSTPYPLASVTKPMVATALMVLQERGRVDLDAPALLYADGWQADGAPRGEYSLKQLLNHTSGLGTYASITWRDPGRDQNRAPRDLKSSFLRYGFPAHPPGVVSEYSNLGYGLIGYIIAQQSGQSLPAFLETEVFKPLGMRNTSMIDSFSAPPLAAKKYDAEGKVLAETYNDTPGAGNVYASVHDLALFGMFHLAEEVKGASAILQPQTKRLMRSHVEPGVLYPYYNSSPYGLGWYFREQGREANPVVWHEGGMPGASAILVLLPKQNVIAAVLINANDKNALAQTLANHLIKTVDPSHQPVSFEAAEGFRPFSSEPEFLGRWEGSARIDGQSLPYAMTFEDGGKVHIEFPGRAADILPARTTVTGLLNGDLLIATVPGTLPAHDVAQQAGGYVLLRLLRRGDQLAGTMVAYSSLERLEHLYPFPVELRKQGRAVLQEIPPRRRGGRDAPNPRSTNTRRP